MDNNRASKYMLDIKTQKKLMNPQKVGNILRQLSSEMEKEMATTGILPRES